MSNNETLTLTVQYDENTDAEPDTAILEQKFRVLGRYKTSSIQINNGDITTTSTWQYELSPLRSGALTIPEFTINGDSSKPILIEITLKQGNGSSGNTSSSPQDHIYTETLLDKNEVFVQQQAIITWRLVSRYNIIDPQFSAPKIDGALMQDLGSQSYQRSSPEGYIERIIEQSYALFPQKSGILTIPMQQFQLVIDTPQRTNKGYFRAQRSQMRANTEQQTITVNPANTSQASTWLPATGISISQELTGTSNNNSVTAGTAFTRTIRITAEGLSADQLPPVNFQADGIKVYSEKPVLKNETTPSSLTGIREEKAAIIATRAGDQVLPGVSIPWFNTTNKTWQTATLPELIVSVAPASISNTNNNPQVALDANAVTTTPEQPSAPAQQAAATSPLNNSNATENTLTNIRFWQASTVILILLLVIAIIVFPRLKNNTTSSMHTDIKQASTVGISKTLIAALSSSDLALIHRELLKWASESDRQRDALRHPSIAPVFHQLEKYLFGKGSLPDLAKIKNLSRELDALLADQQDRNRSNQQLENLYR